MDDHLDAEKYRNVQNQNRHCVPAEKNQKLVRKFPCNMKDQNRTKDEDSLQKRLSTAKSEFEIGKNYEYVVVNDEVETDIKICAVNAISAPHGKNIFVDKKIPNADNKIETSHARFLKIFCVDKKITSDKNRHGKNQSG